MALPTDAGTSTSRGFIRPAIATIEQYGVRVMQLRPSDVVSSVVEVGLFFLVAAVLVVGVMSLR